MEGWVRKLMLQKCERGETIVKTLLGVSACSRRWSGHYMRLASQTGRLCERRDIVLRLAHSERRTFRLGGVVLVVWDGAPLMLSCILRVVVGSRLEDGFQMRMAQQRTETIVQDFPLVQHSVQTSPSYLANGFDHRALENSVDCHTVTQGTRIQLSE